MGAGADPQPTEATSYRSEQRDKVCPTLYDAYKWGKSVFHSLLVAASEVGNPGEVGCGELVTLAVNLWS